jgi:hypothetical protein
MTSRLDVSRVWASNDPATSIIDPGTTKYALGWIAEIPPFQYMNYLQYRVDLNIKALAERGVFEWGSDVDYVEGALAWDENNSTIYIATVANPDKSLSPMSNLTQWSVSTAQTSSQVFLDLQAALSAHEALVNNPHEVTAIQAGTYTAEQVDFLIADIETSITDHETDLANPHEVTAAQVGAVPITGGSYTGVVDFLAAKTELNRGSAGTTHVDATNGIFLTLDAWALGLNATGVAVWKEGLVEHPVLFSNQFQEFKDIAEPNYAVPVADFHMPLVSDTNIYLGGGTTTTGDDHSFNEAGLLLTLDSEVIVEGADLGFALPSTIHFQGELNNLDSVLHILLGNSNGVRFQKAPNNTEMYLAVPHAAGGFYYLTLPNMLGVHKYTGVVTPSLVIAYIDGVEVARGINTYIPLEGLEGFEIRCTGGEATVKCKDLQLWAQALTPQQVSTL